MFSSETSLLQRAHPWIGDTICGSERKRQIILFMKFLFYLSIIAEDGPDDLAFDVLLLADDLVFVVLLLDDDLDDVSSSDAKVLSLKANSSKSNFGRNEEHVSFLFQIGSSV